MHGLKNRHYQQGIDCAVSVDMITRTARVAATNYKWPASSKVLSPGKSRTPNAYAQSPRNFTPICDW
ncbi:MAG: hypothetical protein MJE68_15575 [Proteobacteria bacterium]|nr:hypothetical protein [Pseudomonadota bacterium]